MKIYGVKCKICGDIIYSRARHDFHYCSCGNVFVDGGQHNHMRFGWTQKKISVITVDVGVSYKKLYNDWNKGIDKYGWIYGEDTRERKLAIAKRKLLE